MPPFQGYGPSVVPCYQEALAKLKEELMPPSTYVKATEALGEVVGDILKDYEMVVCGSFAQGTAVAGSDLDVSLLLKGNTAGVDRTHGVRILEKLMEKLKKTLPKDSNGLQVSEAVLTASVPILRLLYTPVIGVHSSLPIDVSIGNGNSGQRDSIVKDILLCNPSVLLPLSIIKHWTKRRHVVKAYEGFPNSISWSLLFICHCQLIGLLPPHTGIQGWIPNPTCLTEAAILTSFFGFVFQYSSDGTFAAFKCSVSSGCLQQRPHDSGDSPLWVADPVDPTNNVARSIKPHQWSIAVSEANRAFTLLSSFSPLTELLADKLVDSTNSDEGSCSVDEASSLASLPLSEEPPTGRALLWNGEAATLSKFETMQSANLVPSVPAMVVPAAACVGDCVVATGLQKEVHINNAKGVVVEKREGSLKLVDFLDPPHGRLVIDTANIKVLGAEAVFPLSSMVQAHGLVKNKSVNGCNGIVVGHEEGSVLVQFPQPHGGMSVQPRNLLQVKTQMPPSPLVSSSATTSTTSSVGPRRSSVSSLTSDSVDVDAPHSSQYEFELRPTTPPTYYCKATGTTSATPPPGYHHWLGTTLFHLLAYMGPEAPKVTGMLLDASAADPYKVWSLLSSPKQLRAQAMIAAAHIHHHACRMQMQQPAQPSVRHD
eukprot:TRINITY_DN6395_c0_g1_i1.p1 TRINITY_DN6395_c0_g1~~TRINITY_DN6395_c0_g1_i1.p1  ORF type:complete len:654 (+),score=138.21 TRINITY_DN6395_c0_g1_i1:54-2015(+)